jgi:AraC-like DNA-binding protein
MASAPFARSVEVVAYNDVAIEELAIRGRGGCYTRAIKMAKLAEAEPRDVPATNVLARAIRRLAQTDGDHNTAIPALTLHRRSAPSEPLHCIYNLGLGVVAQGEKQVLLGGEAIDYGPGQSMLTTIDLPVVSHITRANVREPFLGMMLTLDVRTVVQIASEMDVPRSRRDDASGSISFKAVDAALLDALIRLVAQNFVEALHGDDLADRAHMSPSTFRQHFRALTGLSPLQYQKQLRLQEARQLMLNQNLDASSAAGQVGYESASQFSREYSRLFGDPPQRDIKRMRLI